MRLRIFAATALILAGTHRAEAHPAVVEGDVHDALGRPIAGAAVSLEDAAGRVVAKAASDPQGHFAFPGVPAGTYAVIGRKAEYDDGSAIVTPGATGATKTDLVLQAQAQLEMAVVATKTRPPRNPAPKGGATTYAIDSQAIKDLPQGANTAINQVLQQAPGVAQDSFGQVHLRGEHANLQYRINGIMLPDGISGFGQVIDSRVVDTMQLLTGTLPAQYGLRTSGVVDIQTKTGAFAPGGTLDMYGGSHATMQPSLTYGGSQGAMTYFISADYLSSDQGIESPTPSPHPIHDATSQGKGFGYVSYLLNPTTQLDAIFGTSVGQFQIPNTPNQSPQYPLLGAEPKDSATINDTQLEQNHYGIVALQGTTGDWSYQIAPYVRYSQTHFSPDTVGDLEYTGVASAVLRSDFATGLQNDASWRLNDRHTLKAGTVVQHESAFAGNTSTVYPLAGGNPALPPETIVDNNHKEGMLTGVYVQDAWKLTPQLTMNYGARFDQVNAYVAENQISPRLGFVYTPTKTTTLHAGYARYFTPPPLELIAPASVAKFANTSAQPEVTQADPVRSEDSNTFDAGISQKLGERWQVGLDGYYKLVHNMLDEGQFGQALVYTPFNYAQGRIYGVETSASFTADRLSGYGNFAVSRAMGKDIVSGQTSFGQAELNYIANNWVHLDHDQTYTASAGITYKLFDATGISADGIFGSGLRNGFANTGHLPWYTQFNLGLTQHVPIDAKGIDLRFSVVNLFDTAYELRDGSGIGVGAPQWGPRRAFFMGLSRAF